MSSRFRAALMMFLGGCFFALPGWAGVSGCAPDLALLASPDGTVIGRFNVELARTDAERERGLMDRSAMPASSGMLFIYPSPRQVAFWMRNTLIPLDILFFDAAGRMVSKQDMAQPLDETPLPSAGAAQFVLEINGGLAKKLGIGAGTALANPAIARGRAALPCEG